MEEESAERTQCRVSDDGWRGAAYAIEKGSKLVSAVIDNSVARLDEGEGTKMYVRSFLPRLR